VSRAPKILAVSFLLFAFFPSTTIGAQASGCGGAFYWMTTQNPAGASNVFHGVAAISKTDVWGVGSRLGATGGTYKTLAEHWDGASWTTIPTVDPDGSGDGLGAVDGLSSQDVWGVGSHGAGFTSQYPLAEHWNGTSWTQVAVSAPGFGVLAAVKEISPTSIWAVGGGQIGSSTPLIERSKGAGFTAQTIGSFGDNGTSLGGVDGLSKGDVWAVGGYFDASNIGHPLALHWNGTTWSEVPPITPDGMTNAFFHDVVEVASDDVWAVGHSVDADGIDHTLVEHWTGSWSVVPSPSPTGSDALEGVAAVNASHLYAAGVRGDLNHPRPLIERWNGSAWNVVALPTGTHPIQLHDVAALPTGYVWAAGTANKTTPKTVMLERCP
jgi:hypothetical protein